MLDQTLTSVYSAGPKPILKNTMTTQSSPNRSPSLTATRTQPWVQDKTLRFADPPETSNTKQLYQTQSQNWSFTDRVPVTIPLLPSPSTDRYLPSWRTGESVTPVRSIERERFVQTLPREDLVEQSHPSHVINSRTHADFLDYRHYPPYEHVHPSLGRPDYHTHPNQWAKQTNRLNPYSFELKVEDPKDSRDMSSIYKETRNSPGDNKIRHNNHSPLPGDPIQATTRHNTDPPTGWDLLDDRIGARLPRYPSTREYQSSYMGPEYVDYRHHLARYPSLIDDVDFKTYYHRLYEDLRNLDSLKSEDFSQTFRYPYTAAFTQNSSLARSPLPKNLHNPLYDYIPDKPDYFDLMHRPESYHHRLDPGYLTNYHSFNSYYPYVHRGENLRLDYPETFEKPMGRPPRDRNIRTDADYAQWLKRIRASDLGGHTYNRVGPNLADEMMRGPGLYDRYFSSSQRELKPEEKLLNLPPLYLTPSRLYDNPDYRDLRRKSKLL